jgi:DNA-binding transcriptional ArsR family regulator
MINDTTILRRRAEVRFRVVGEEGVVIRQDAAEVLAVNEVGASILSLLDAERTLADVLEALSLEYATDGESLRRDVEAFLVELREAGVVEEVGTP